MALSLLYSIYCGSRGMKIRMDEWIGCMCGQLEDWAVGHVTWT